MFSSTIGLKANKIKLNIDTYINEKKKENHMPQPVPSVRRPEPPISAPNTLTSQPSNISNPNTGSGPAMIMSNPQSKTSEI